MAAATAAALKKKSAPRGPSLKKIDLSYNQLTDLKILGVLVKHVPNLTEINLANNQFQQVPKPNDQKPIDNGNPNFDEVLDTVNLSNNPIIFDDGEGLVLDWLKHLFSNYERRNTFEIEDANNTNESHDDEDEVAGKYIVRLLDFQTS